MQAMSGAHVHGQLRCRAKTEAHALSKAHAHHQMMWGVHVHACQMCVARRISGRISLTLKAQGVWNRATSWNSTAAVFCLWLSGMVCVTCSGRSAARHLRSTLASAFGILPAQRAWLRQVEGPPVAPDMITLMYCCLATCTGPLVAYCCLTPSLAAPTPNAVNAHP